MDNPTPSLPSLTFNRSFLKAFMTETPPCLALGMLEIEQKECGLFALATKHPVPDEITAQGFQFGTQLLGTQDCEVILFTFEFYGFERFNILLNPNNPLVQSVLKHMVNTNDYFILARGEQGKVTTFRSEPHHDTLYYLAQDIDRILTSTTTDEQYLNMVTRFMKNPNPPGKLLRLVCHETLEYLDLSRDRHEIKPME